MPAGIEIINNFGTVLINDLDPVLQLRTKYSVTATVGLPRYYDLVINNVTHPVIAIRCPGYYAYLLSYSRSGSTLTIRVGVFATVNVALDIYHFDVPAAPAASGYGLQVFNAAGACTFDSNGKTAVVAAVNPATGTWTGTSGRTYAFAFHTVYNKYITFPDSGSTYYFEQYINAARCNGSTIDVHNDYLWSNGTESGSDPGINQVSGYAGGLVLDVTGY